jgi:hypothetical protein
LSSSVFGGSWLGGRGSKDQEDRDYGGTRTTVPPSDRGYWPVLISTSAEAHVGLYRYIVIPIPESLALERRCRENSSKPPRCGDLYLPGVAVRLPLGLPTVTGRHGTRLPCRFPWAPDVAVPCAAAANPSHTVPPFCNRPRL